MKSCEEIVKLLAHNKPHFERRFKVRRIGVFGSVARGDAIPGSDIDIIVDVDPSIGLDFVTLADEIEHLLGEHVDVISHRAINSRHWREIEQDIVYV
ncbi:nucleotidyltransferase family protein [bacterium]|nr:nucleotidyltransferase family protein [bacterium]